MDEQQNYDAVWERVFARPDAPPPPPPPGGPPVPPPPPPPGERPDRLPPPGRGDRERLENFIDRESQDIVVYRELARRYPRNAQAFRQMANRDEGILRRLRTAHFILTGDLYISRTRRPDIRSLTVALRQQYRVEQQAEEAYERAANETRNRNLRQLYEDGAQASAANARILMDLLERLMR